MQQMQQAMHCAVTLGHGQLGAFPQARVLNLGEQSRRGRASQGLRCSSHWTLACRAWGVLGGCLGAAEPVSLCARLLACSSAGPSATHDHHRLR